MFLVCILISFPRLKLRNILSSIGMTLFSLPSHLLHCFFISLWQEIITCSHFLVQGFVCQLTQLYNSVLFSSLCVVSEVYLSSHFLNVTVFQVLKFCFHLASSIHCSVYKYSIAIFQTIVKCYYFV